MNKKWTNRHFFLNAMFMIPGFFLLCYPVFAQQTVTGKVTDANNGEPLTGATVLIKGTTIGTVTDLDGSYQIKTSTPDDVLVFSFVGYLSQEIKVADQTVINVALKEENIQLDELVVIGYGTVKKKDLTGSVAVVSAGDITKSPLPTFTQALQGKAAGVYVAQTSGKPGEGISIRVRGIGSINRSSDPIYVVDGIITGNLNSINPNDIETLQVLKDASASAIYGADGANGVVIITTKKGQSGKPKVSYSSYGSINRTPKKLKVMNASQYADFYNTILAEKGITEFAYSDEFRQKYYGNGWEKGTDWQDQITQKAYAQSHYLNVSGGTENSSYSISGSFYDETGILRKTGATRYNLRANSDFTIGKILKIGETFNLSRMSYQNIGSQTGNAWQVSTITSPLMKVFNPNNKGGYEGPQIPFEYEPGVFYNNTGGNDKTNPRAELDLPDFRSFGNSFLGSIYAEIKPLSWLTYRIAPSFDISNGRDKNWLIKYDLGVRSNNRASLAENYYEYIGLSLENQIIANLSFGKHTFTGTLVHQIRKNDSRNISGTGYGFNYESLDVLSMSNEADRVLGGGVGSFRMLSYLGRIIYDYDGKYLITASLRRDGVSRFAPSRRFGTFPSFSAAWKVNEDFLQNVTQISLLKLRFGWGATGNSNIGDFQYDDFLDNTSAFAPVFGNPQKLVPGMYIFYSFANPAIKWESAYMTNFGLDFGLLNNQLQGSIEYYIKNQEDLLVRVPISMVFGRSGDQSEPWANAGKLQNRGVEMNLSYRKSTGRFTYSVSGNLTTIKNEVKYLPQKELVTGNNITYPGHTIGSLYGWIAERIITPDDFDSNGNYLYALPSSGKPSPGDLKFKDLNHDGTINDLDKTIIGKPWPDVVLGLSFDCSYKGFDFSVFFNSMLNYDVFNAQRAGLSSFNSQDLNHNKLLDYALNYYRPDKPSTEYVRADINNSNINDRISTWWIEKASFLRCRDVQFGYSLPSAFIGKAGISRTRIYLSAMNLFTLTKYTGRDPEGAAGSSPLTSGTDGGTYPIPRSFTLGIQVDF
ncbi:MAG TPA: TonB-dependent receptor [Bacteroidales bacterium]|nr:TonB-dependent receptor [Bacteroidales bacterium]